MIEADHLNFGFSKSVPLLKGINLRVEKGSIYGFAGPNGAGKTTLIRLLLGLLPDKENRIRLFGEHLKDNRIHLLSRIGCLIEQPSLYEQISGFDNMEITRKIRNAKSSQAEEALEQVGLTTARHLEVSKYSLGMKQRLGLAIALLTNPELLILDEPVNGLDPEGIVEIRQLLIKLNREAGITIFLSSHLLSEIEKMVTHLGILHKGRLVFQGSMAEIEALKQKNGSTSNLETIFLDLIKINR